MLFYFYLSFLEEMVGAYALCQGYEGVLIGSIIKNNKNHQKKYR